MSNKNRILKKQTEKNTVYTNEEIRLKSIELKEPETFEEAFDYLKNFKGLLKNLNDFKYFMNLKWNSTREKQETYFRLFAYLGLINDFKEYEISDGNFNEGKINLIKNYIIDLKDKKIKDTNDKSDLTLYKFNTDLDEGDLIVSTSKNLEDYQISSLEINILNDTFKTCMENNIFPSELKIKNCKICVVIPNKNVFYQKLEQCRNGVLNEKIIKGLNDYIIIDQSDLYKNYLAFNKLFGNNNFNDLYKIEKKILIPKFHQDLTLKKTINLFENNIDDIIWGQICRSGKTFMMAKLIIINSNLYRNDDDIENYLIITLAPSETIPQYLDIFEKYIEFDDYEIILDDIVKTNKNKKIYIYSKQKICNEKNIKSFNKFFKKTKFEITFVDEAHYGGVTDISKDVYKKINSKKIIYMSATYSKPMIHFDIPFDNCVLFDLYDYELLKNIRKNSKILIEEKEVIVSNKQILANRYNLTIEEIENLISIYEEEQIEKDYEINPQLHVLTWQMNEETVNQIDLLKVKDEYAGYSLDSLFLLNKENIKDKNGKTIMKFIPSFQNAPMVKKQIRFLFGNNNLEYYDEYDKMSFMERIHNIRRINSEEDKKEIILCFLPMGFGSNIDCLSEAFKNIYEEDRNNLIDYSILIINNARNDGKDAKRLILEGFDNLEPNKKGLIVLTGKQCHLGVTLEHCDTVILLNNLENIDTIYQMAFRAMSQRKNKKSAYLIDLDIQRMMQFIVNFSTKTFKNYSITNAIKKLLKSHIIRFNSDVWSNYFEMMDSIEGNENLDSLSKKIFNTWSIKQKSCLKSLLNDFSYVNLLKNVEDQKYIDSIFSLEENNKKNTKKNIEELNGKNTDLSRGIEIKKYHYENDDENDNNNEDDEENNDEEDEEEDDEDQNETIQKYQNYTPKVNFVKDVLRNIIPMMCLLTINEENNNTFDKMYNVIKNKYTSKFKSYYLDLLKNDIESVNNKINENINELEDKLKRTRVENKKNLLKNMIQTNINSVQHNINILTNFYNNEKIEYLKENIKEWNELKNIFSEEFIIDENNNKIKLFDYLLKKYIGNNNSLESIFDEQVKLCWGKHVPTNVIEKIKKIFEDNLKDNEDINNLIKRIKEIFKNTLYNYHELSNLIDEYLKPLSKDKEDNAEVSTPFDLRKDMLDKIPIEFWSDANNKVFEPCSGKGGFLIDIVDRFMIGLKNELKNDEARYKYIVENCIYFSEKSSMNIYINKLLLDPYDKFQLNYYEGDTLDINLYQKWNINGFNAIVGNPPYNNKQEAEGKKGGGDLLWNKFLLKSINNWLLNDGYLLYVHPSGWRKPESDRSKYKGLFKLMTHDNQMIYLEIHDTKDGMKVFKCGTRYDWYLLQKTKCFKETIINDEKRNISSVDLSQLEFLPNYDFAFLISLLKKKDEEGVNILFSRNDYESRKKYVSEEETTEFKYPLIHSTPQKGVRYMYSSTNEHGLFGVPKIIFGESGINKSAIIDINGLYGMTQEAMAIHDNIENFENIKKAIESDRFSKLLNACSWSNFRIDWRLFTYLRKNFWKEFV